MKTVLNNFPSHYDKNRWVISTLLIFPIIIMCYNALTLPTLFMYDAQAHISAIRYFNSTSIIEWLFPKDNSNVIINMYSPIYYAIGGLLLKCFNLSDYWLVLYLRFIGILFFLFFSFTLLHLIFCFTEKNIFKDSALILSMCCFPGLYVFVAQVRPEILFMPLLACYLLLFKAQLNFFIIIATAIVLCLISLTKHSGVSLLPIMVAALAIKMRHANLSIKFIVIFSSILIACCLAFYIVKSVQTNGYMFPKTDYVVKYMEKQKELNRFTMFSNMEFGKLFHTPNRNAQFSDMNNSIFPRLYGDMWGDHWLYFSGNDIKQDNKVFFKRIAFIAGSFFTMLWFCASILGAFQCIICLAKRNIPTFFDITAALSFVTLVFLVFTAVFIYSEPGKNSIIKFSYIMPMALLSIPKMQECITKFIPVKYYAAYLLLVIMLCLPLYIYTK